MDGTEGGRAGRGGNPRIIFHVDMDAFYAGVEMRDDPSLCNVPLVIGADPRNGKGRGVVCTANYPARKFGIRSAMSISQAWRLAPHAVFLPPDFSKYAPASDAVMQVLEKYADVLEVVGMDEAYLDMTICCSPDGVPDWDLAHSIARSLQAAVKRETGLSCSVGIAPCKAVAKIATDRRKPHGITLVLPDEVTAFLDPLPVRALNGCGPKTAGILKDEGIATIGDLARTSPRTLDGILGSHGDWLHRIAHGDDPRPVVADHGPRKSRGNETTFGRDQREPSKVMRTARGLLDEILADHSKRDRRAFTTITVKLRYEDFTTLTRAHTADIPYELHQPETAALCASRVAAILAPLLDGRAVRLVGVRFSGFVEQTGQQLLARFGLAVQGLLARSSVDSHGRTVSRASLPFGAFDPGGLRQGLLASFAA